MGQTMSFYQSEPVAEDKHWSMQEEALKRAGLAEAERMAKRTAEREASAQGQPLDEDEERQRRAIAAEVNVIAPGGSPNTSPMFGEPLLGEPGEYYCCQRAADHILSAICRGYVHLLTPRIFEALDPNLGASKQLEISNLGSTCTYGTHTFAAASSVTAPLVRPLSLLGFAMMPAAMPMMLTHTLVVEPVVSNLESTRDLEDLFLQRYGFPRDDVLSEAGKAFWNLETGDTCYELAIKPVFSIFYGEEVITKQISRVLHRLLHVDLLGGEYAKARRLCYAIIRSRRALNAGYGASAARNTYRIEAALDVLQHWCTSEWELGSPEWSDETTRPFGRVCRSFAVLPVDELPGVRQPLREALLEEMSMIVQTEEQQAEAEKAVERAAEAAASDEARAAIAVEAAKTWSMSYPQAGDGPIKDLII